LDKIEMTSKSATSRDFRVVVWNMAKSQRAWKALDGLSPDLCLLCEAQVPKGRQGHWSVEGTRGRDKAKRQWSAAIVTASEATPIEDASLDV
jgi:hypothetical protein